MGAHLTAGDAIAEREAMLAACRVAPQMAEITLATSRFFGVPVVQILGDARRAELVRPRHIAMHLCCRLTAHSTKRIGRFFNRHHSSVIHARDVIEMHVDENPEVARQVAAILDAVTGSNPQQERSA